MDLDFFFLSQVLWCDKQNKRKETDRNHSDSCNKPFITDTTRKRGNIMNMLPSKIHDHNKGLDYTLVGDYYLPDLKPFKAPPLCKYGRMRLRYLKKHRPCTYTALLLSGKLYDDLHDADGTA